MSGVGDSLHRLIGIMAEVGKPIAENVNPGLLDSDIARRCQQVGIVLPPELFDLYRYCDGMKYGHDLDGLYTLLSLDAAFQEYEVVKENAPYYDEPTIDWFPFLSDEGDLYLVDMAAAKTGNPSVVWWMLEFPPIRKYSNLSSMFNTLADAYEAGAYENLYDSPYLNGNLQMALIARQRNPDVAYWQERIQQLSGS